MSEDTSKEMKELIQNGEALDAGTEEATPLSDAYAVAEVSDSVTRALADSLAKISEYVPINYVDNMEPDINAENLNKNEQALMRVTALMNSAVDVIKDLQSQVTQVNSDLGKGSQISTSILQKALDLPVGFYVYHLSGNTYTGNDLPDNLYKYGTAIIYKRSISHIEVVLYGPANGTPLAINSYNNTMWNGWSTYVRNSDFEAISVCVTTIANKVTIIEGAPKSDFYIPVIISRTTTNATQDTIAYESENWKIYSSTSQDIVIRFFKYPFR